MAAVIGLTLLAVLLKQATGDDGAAVDDAVDSTAIVTDTAVAYPLVAPPVADTGVAADWAADTAAAPATDSVAGIAAEDGKDPGSGAGFSAAALSRADQLGYRPAQVLVNASFDVAEEDTSYSVTFSIRGGRAYITPRGSRTEGGRLWRVSTTNFIARVKLRYESGPANYGAGLKLREGICVLLDTRRENNTPWGYLVSESIDGAWKDLVPWTASSAIRDNEENLLEVVAIGSSISLFVNGRYVNTATGATHQSGEQIELRVEGTGATYSFDDFVVTALQPE